MASPLELKLSGLGWSVVGLLALMVLLCTQKHNWITVIS